MSNFCFTATIQHLPGLFILAIFILENNLLLLGFISIKITLFIIIFYRYRIRTRLMNRLRLKAETYETAFNTIGFPMIIVDHDKKIMASNKAFETLSGYSEKELEGKYFNSELICSGCLEKFEKSIEQQQPKTQWNRLALSGKINTTINIWAQLAKIENSDFSLITLTNNNPYKALTSKSEEQYQATGC